MKVQSRSHIYRFVPNFLDNRKLRGKVFIRQRKDARTKTYLLWFQRKGERQ